MRLKVVPIIALTSFLIGCAGPSANNTFEVASKKDDVFTACLEGVSDIHYAPKAVDRQSGLTLAEQGVVGGSGSTVGLTVRVTPSQNGSTVSVAFTAPPMTLALGRFQGITTEYEQAVRKHLPNT